MVSWEAGDKTAPSADENNDRNFVVKNNASGNLRFVCRGIELFSDHETTAPKQQINKHAFG